MKIIFFDIDGTLADKYGHISESTKFAIRKASNNNCKIFINTGRCKAAVDPDIDALGIDGYVLGCGTQIIVDGEEILRKEFIEADALKIKNILVKNDVFALIEGIDYIGYDFNKYGSEFIKDYSAYKNKDYKIVDYNQVEKFSKVFCMDVDAKKLKILQKELKEYFTFTDRGNKRYELVPIGYNKGIGVEKVCEALKVGIEDTIAFGDSENDMEMFRVVEDAVAMEGSPIELINISSFVTSSTMFGIEEGLKKLRLI